jgi:prevent-host-death family protein
LPEPHAIALHQREHRILCESGDEERFVIDLSKDIHSMTEFKRRTSEFVARLKKTGRPVVLTTNGRAEIVVQDAAAYQKLLEAARRLELLEAERRAESAPSHRPYSAGHA